MGAAGRGSMRSTSAFPRRSMPPCICSSRRHATRAMILRLVLQNPSTHSSTCCDIPGAPSRALADIWFHTSRRFTSQVPDHASDVTLHSTRYVNLPPSPVFIPRRSGRKSSISYSTMMHIRGNLASHCNPPSTGIYHLPTQIFTTTFA